MGVDYSTPWRPHSAFGFYSILLCFGILGGATPSTRKRYKAVFDKFSKFLVAEGVSSWEEVTKRTLESYGAWLEYNEYAYRTEFLELMTIIQAMNWLIRDEKALPASCHFRLNLTKPPAQTTRYCYTNDEVAAIITKCSDESELHWLASLSPILSGTSW